MNEELIDSSQNNQTNGEHPALAQLKELLKKGTITQETYDNLNFKFEKLDKAFEQSCSSEKILQR